MMETRKNKQAATIYNAYLKSNCYSVLQAYKTTPSIYKINAETGIKNEMNDNGGINYKVISSNGFMFTCGYTMQRDGKTIFVYHTKTRRDEILVNGGYKSGYVK